MNAMGKEELKLFEDVSVMIEQSRRSVYVQANSTTVLLFWKIGKHVNHNILENKRADYGERIVVSLSQHLEEKYGRSFNLRNVRRMMQFSEQFPDFEIVSRLATQLTWSHFVEVLPLKTSEEKLFYINEAVREYIGRDELRELIRRKTYERKEIANARVSSNAMIPLNAFKDPYLFDILGLKDEYLEADLEAAIIRELEKFILEFGKGFAFIERQKRMIIDGKDFHLDLLFYNRHLKRLVAVELKQGQFCAEYNGQMKLYLKWLNRYERREDENEPIGLILCTEGNREQIELLEMDKDGIMVAEYWTTLPPRKVFEEKIHNLFVETRERMEQHRLIASTQKLTATLEFKNTEESMCGKECKNGKARKTEKIGN